MKKLRVVGLMNVLMVSLVLLGCTAKADIAPEVLPLNGGEEAKTIEISTDEFGAQNHMIVDMELVKPGSLIVSLGANPTTGFQWGEIAEISSPSVVAQQSHSYVDAQGNSGQVVGAPGKDVWVFDSLTPGMTTISLSFGRPWEGGSRTSGL